MTDVIRPVDHAARVYATDPSHHVVLEASAGTGKTRVLVDRYLALLTAGVDPRHILAITFTRKAAAEMRERIVTDLRARHPAVWQRLRDHADEIAVSTIDAFCFSLLREFPLEAGLDPGFGLADETEVARLVETSLDQTLRDCRARAPHDEAIRLVLAQLTLPRLAQGLRALLERRFVAPAALARYLGRQHGTIRSEQAAADLARRELRGALLGLSGGLHAWLASGPVRSPEWDLVRRDVEALVASEAEVPMRAADIRASLDELSSYVLTQDGKPRQRPRSKRDTFANADAYQRHGRGMADVAQAVIAARRGLDTALNVLLARGIRRIFRLAYRRYRQVLVLHDALDFSEVLWRAVQLLGQMDEFSRSRFRLEARYQHVLVDEFQDTSRLQWELVRSLVQAWGEGFGLGHEGPVPPSIFLVGDRKQSIYRFRDADVGLLDEALTFVQELAQGEPVRQAIAQSFRSHPDLLAFANDVAIGMVEPGAPPAVAFRYGPDDRFPLPADLTRRDDEAPRLGLIVAEDAETCAASAAAEIARLLETGLVTERGQDAPRRARPGDIAILFRSRESHREFERALAARGIPSYVYKGLGFYDSDEIKDLVALVRVLAAPESDLRAAAFLRSGFVRVSDDTLRRLAPHLAACLRAPVPDEPAFPDDDREALRRLRGVWPAWLGLVDRRPPADVVDHILEASAYASTLRGSRQAQARENVKKFRSLLRRIQNRGYATMARIAAHIDRVSAGDEANAAVDAADAVNLMTVHASKGLEFPIVFLVNLTRGTGGLPPPLRVVAGDDQEEPVVGIARYEPGAAEAERVRDREESKRLMYVAVTRARERLYLSAAIPSEVRGPIDRVGSLASVAPRSLLDVLRAAALPDRAPGDEVVWQGAEHAHRFRVCPPVPVLDVPTDVAATEIGADAPRSLQPLTDVQSPRRHRVTDLVNPGVFSDATPGPGLAELVAGRAVHRALAYRDAAGRPLTSPVALRARIAADLEPDERLAVEDVNAFASAVCDLVTEVWRDDTLREALGSPDARFEVPVVFRQAVNGQVRVVRGTIDCLVPQGDRVLVIEIKTGERRSSHARQLELYEEAVRLLMPGLRVQGRLVYASRRAASAPSAARLPFD